MTRRRTQRYKNTKKRSQPKKRVRKTRVRTRRKQRGGKQSGGTCYGTGVGANSMENNFSVFNTNQLKLFPYKP